MMSVTGSTTTKMVSMSKMSRNKDLSVGDPGSKLSNRVLKAHTRLHGCCESPGRRWSRSCTPSAA